MARRREELLRELTEENRISSAEGVFFLQAVAERSGMTLTDIQCVNILALAGATTAGRLAEMMGLTTGAVTGVINRLEKSGYVRREKDPEDGRRVVIRPVGEKLERVGAVFSGSGEWDLTSFFSEYDDRDLALFVEVMKKSNAASREATARIRAESRGYRDGSHAAPLEGVANGRLVFSQGASRLLLRAEDGMDELYRADFGGTAPKIRVEEGTVTVSRPRRYAFFGRDKESEEFTLNAGIPWEIEVRGGASRVQADLGNLRLSSLTLKAGMSEVYLALPEPAGTVPVRLSGGASKVEIRRPLGTGARVSLKGGASRLVFDDQSFDALGGKVRLHSQDYDESSDHYEIEISGGASEVSIRQGTA